MIVLALDPSSKAIGWALSDPGRMRLSGVFHPLDWRSKAQEEFARHQRMCGRAGEWLADMITDYGPCVVVLETPTSSFPGRSEVSTRCLQRLLGSLMLVLYTREIATVPVLPREWQGWAKHNLPGFVKSDEADARGILEWWMATGAHRVESAETADEKPVRPKAHADIEWGPA